MNIENELKKEGIEVTNTLDTLKVNSIAKDIAQKLVAAFPEHDFKLGELFIRLSRLKMYTAKIPEGLAEANYFYKNSSIYFNDTIDLSKIDKFAMHECIHYLQEKKDKKGHLMRLGLCDLTEFKVTGLALNEAAVQLITSKALDNKSDEVKYYGISFATISPNCYPLLCNLINQMAYITGEYTLFDSTFNSTDNFKDKFISLTSQKTFDTISANFDTILYTEEELIKLNNKLMDSNDVSFTIQKINSKVAKLKQTIQETFFKTQDMILSSYFNKAFGTIADLEGVENYRRKLYNYKNLIGSTDNYNYFNNFYIDMMSKLEKKYNQIETGEFEEITNEITVVKHNKFIEFIKAIKKFLFKTGDEYEKIDEK